MAKLLHTIEQHDGVRHHDADQHQEPNECRNADWTIRDQECREGTNHGERQAEHDDKWINQRVEDQHHGQVHKQDCDGHRREEAAERLVLLLRHAGEPYVDLTQLPCILKFGDCGLDRSVHGSGVCYGDLTAHIGGKRLVNSRDA